MTGGPGFYKGTRMRPKITVIVADRAAAIVKFGEVTLHSPQVDALELMDGRWEVSYLGDEAPPTARAIRRGPPSGGTPVAAKVPAAA